MSTKENTPDQSDASDSDLQQGKAAPAFQTGEARDTNGMSDDKQAAVAATRQRRRATDQIEEEEVVPEHLLPAEIKHEIIPRGPDPQAPEAQQASAAAAVSAAVAEPTPKRAEPVLHQVAEGESHCPTCGAEVG